MLNNNINLDLYMFLPISPELSSSNSINCSKIVKISFLLQEIMGNIGKKP